MVVPTELACTCGSTAIGNDWSHALSVTKNVQLINQTNLPATHIIIHPLCGCFHRIVPYFSPNVFPSVGLYTHTHTHNSQPTLYTVDCVLIVQISSLFPEPTSCPSPKQD